MESLPPRGLIALSTFFGLGAVIASVAFVALLTPGGVLEALWRLNPTAHSAFLQMGPTASLLMACVAIACAGAAVGLWLQARWGHRLALLLLVVNFAGDMFNALFRGDARTLIGLPIAGVLIAYLLRRRVRARFLVRDAAVKPAR